jgi:hypothetical protein
MQGAYPNKSPFTPPLIYGPEYSHIDIKYLPQMAGKDRRSHVFVSIDKARHWIFYGI